MAVHDEASASAGLLRIQRVLTWVAVVFSVILSLLGTGLFLFFLVRHGWAR